MTPKGFRFIGIAPEVDLTERRSKMINDQTEPFTTDDIRGYKVFTALLTQSGESYEQNITSGNLTIGVTYQIGEDGSGFDFINVGSPNNNKDTYFIATGEIPNSWGIGGKLYYNFGAPVANVLENTIGNIWFEYLVTGVYVIKSDNVFIIGKTNATSNLTNYNSDINDSSTAIEAENAIILRTLNNQDTYNNFTNLFVEIRLYN